MSKFKWPERTAIKTSVRQALSICHAVSAQSPPCKKHSVERARQLAKTEDKAIIVDTSCERHLSENTYIWRGKRQDPGQTQRHHETYKQTQVKRNIALSLFSCARGIADSRNFASTSRPGLPINRFPDNVTSWEARIHDAMFSLISGTRNATVCSGFQRAQGDT